MISLRNLFQNTFEGHKGRKGKQGGSLPKSEMGGSVSDKFEEHRGRPSSDKSMRSEPRLPSDRGYRKEDTSISDAMKGFDDDSILKDPYTPEHLESEYKMYKKMSLGALREEYKYSHKVNDIMDRSMDKEAIISDLMRSKFGKKRVDAWLEQYPE